MFGSIAFGESCCVLVARMDLGGDSSKAELVIPSYQLLCYEVLRG